jgi:glutamate-ammonia-ligase adenylyltransferase
VAGDAALGERLLAVRRTVLTRPRDADAVREEVVAMRMRWRNERDRSDAARLDLKQGAGALLDIEFLLQGLVLANASAMPSLLERTANAALIEAGREAGLLEARQARALGEAHAGLLTRSLVCTLDARPRMVARDADVERHCAAVLEIARVLGFDFRAQTDETATR